MAILQGRLEPIGRLLSPTMFSNNFYAYLGQHVVCQSIKPTLESVSGVWTYRGKTTIPCRFFTGQYNPGYSDLLYNKIYVTPSFIDVGQLLTNKSYTLEIWNAYFEPRNLLTIDKQDMEGVDFPLNPGQFKPLESKTITVTFSTNGPAVINSLINLGFDLETPSISFSGSRLIVFSLSPDWEAGITEKISYLTNIITAYDDSEQRIQLRGAPRKSLVFKITTLTSQESAFLDALLFGWQSRVYGVPIWMDAQSPAQDIISGSSSIFVATNYYRFRVGGMALIFSDLLSFETVDIIDVKPSFITTKKPIANSWSKNKVLVIPLERGRVDDTIDLTKPSCFHALASIAFNLEVI